MMTLELSVSIWNGQARFATTVQVIHAAMHLYSECFLGVNDEPDAILGRA